MHSQGKSITAHTFPRPLTVSLIISDSHKIFRYAFDHAYSWILLNFTSIEDLISKCIWNNLFSKVTYIIFLLKNRTKWQRWVGFYKKDISDYFNVKIHLWKNSSCFYSSGWIIIKLVNIILSLRISQCCISSMYLKLSFL